MPFWVFAITSTVGRMPGTWVLAAQGAKTAEGEYLQLVLLTAAVAAVALPLYYYYYYYYYCRRLIMAALGRRGGEGSAQRRVQDEG